MRLNIAVPEAHVTKPILDAALEGVTRLNETLLDDGRVPTFDQALPSGIRWKPEPPGQEHFDHAGIVLGRGWGDCDDLAPWHAASLRATGEDPGARAVVRKSGPKRWHAIVQRSDGTVDDPSLDAGMPGPGRKVGVHGAAIPVMFARKHDVGSYVPRPQLALRPIVDQHGFPEAWQARADLPWHWQTGKSPGDVAMASLHSSPVSSQAIIGACVGAIELGEASGFSHDDHLERMAAIADACDGASWEDLADEYGEDHADAAGQIVGSFFGGVFKDLKRAVTHPADIVRHPLNTLAIPFGGKHLVRRVLRTKGAMPAISRAVQFVPGVGPVASAALDAATPALKQAYAQRAHLPPQMRQMPPMGPSAPWGSSFGGGYPMPPMPWGYGGYPMPFR